MYKLLLEIAFNVMQRAIRSSGHNNDNGFDDDGDRNSQSKQKQQQQHQRKKNCTSSLFKLKQCLHLHSKVDLVCFLNDFVAVEAFQSLAFSDKL